VADNVADTQIIVKGLCGRGFYNTGLYLNGVVTPNMPVTDPVPPVVEPSPKPLGDPPAVPVPPPIEPPPLPAQVQGF
jgi:hypothetical protein